MAQDESGLVCRRVEANGESRAMEPVVPVRRREWPNYPAITLEERTSVVRIVVAGRNVSLSQPDVFTAFDVLTDLEVDGVLAALDESGAPCGDPRHVFVAVSAIRSLAGDAVTEAWERDFGRMCDYAASNGWLNETGDMIKAHLSVD
jgi:hypothetical protein